MIQLTEFVGYCYHSCSGEDMVKEFVVCITASCKSEALGLLLERYPKTYANDWDIYGGYKEACDFGYTDIILEKIRNCW